jgi:hypothetical protein
VLAPDVVVNSLTDLDDVSESGQRFQVEEHEDSAVVPVRLTRHAGDDEMPFRFDKTSMMDQPARLVKPRHDTLCESIDEITGHGSDQTSEDHMYVMGEFSLVSKTHAGDHVVFLVGHTQEGIQEENGLVTHIDDDGDPMSVGDVPRDTEKGVREDIDIPLRIARRGGC